MIGIYKITSPSGKIYIGKSINIEERINSYRYAGRRRNQTKLNNSINKYGLKNHIFEVIEECNLDNIDNREIYWIKYYKSVKEGLNLTHGGEGGLLSEESNNKKSKSMLGKTHTNSTKKKMSEAKKGHSMYNEEWKAKMKANTWKLNKGNIKPIIQCDLSGNPIKEFVSSAEAKRYLGLKPNSTGINNVLAGTSKTAHGYIWKYKK